MLMDLIEINFQTRSIRKQKRRQETTKAAEAHLAAAERHVNDVSFYLLFQSCKLVNVLKVPTFTWTSDLRVFNEFQSVFGKLWEFLVERFFDPVLRTECVCSSDFLWLNHKHEFISRNWLSETSPCAVNLQLWRGGYFYKHSKPLLHRQTGRRETYCRWWGRKGPFQAARRKSAVQTVAVKQQVAVLKPDHLAEGQRSKQSVNLSGECGFTPSEAELWRHTHTHTHVM